MLRMLLAAAIAAIFAFQYSPQTALGTFRLADGFQIELFAAEPLVADPVAMEVDENGRTYVVEMHGYPLDVAGSGRVMLLQDTDGDGRPDRSTVFADGFRLPNGIMRWKKGVLVTDAPDIWYLEDTDGDGRAEIKRVMLTGFARTNPQHMMNTPIYGLDNWIYVANESPVRTIRYQSVFGDAGSEIEFPDRPQGPRLPADGGGRNVRFRPDSYEAEILASRGQFGHTFDAWGHHFLNTNNRHIYQEVIQQRYVLRNPSLVVPSVVQQLPDYRQPADVFAITNNPEFQLLTDVGVMTSASGLTYYAADLFPPAYRTAAFVAESAHNLVHVDSVREQGATFRSSRMFEGREFLASTDPWFRPVNFYLGPDGALYVIDYYREIIEHPEWLDEETAKSPRLYAGRDKGRIYRITPKGTAPASWLDRIPLGHAPAPDVVRALTNPNIWWRRNAQRLLVDRNPRDAIGPLTSLAASTDSPMGRVHALWTLDGLRKLDARTIDAALADPDPGVRENAIQLAELHLRGNPSLVPKLISMRNDPHPRVRYQLLLTLGSVDLPAASDVRNELLFADVEDDWVQLAALSAPGSNPAKLWHAATSRFTDKETPARAALIARIAGAAGTGKRRDVVVDLVRSTVSAASGGWWRTATLEGLAGGIRSGAKPGAELDAERTLVADLAFSAEAPLIRHAAFQLLEALGIPGDVAAPVLQKAEHLVADPRADAESRADAVGVLALRDVKPYAQLLRGVLERPEPAGVQAAAVRALAAPSGVAAAAVFVDLWDRWTPAVRAEAVRALVREPARIRLLLDAVGAGKINASEIDRSLRIRMMMVDDNALRARARALFPESIAGGDMTRRDDRARAIARYQSAVAMSGDAERGRQVFGRVCSVCHQYRGANGTPFGPDLGEVRHHLPASLLVDILDPNHSIADRFALWNVVLTDGSEAGGIIIEETADSVTFRLPGGTQSTVPRARIKSMRVSNISAMPEGLETQIDVQQMADLIAFIRNGT